ncbi:arginyltransferase [Candidatus Laterigemmans baculatus]|uniref:arginyltransferase n=1 Tax=Candidatus Laterigemmans baculatus TaxID=2770505 RepID=UPI0013DCEB46|nr:arginyltransferase [Candidatus Laterigemmans baculatus]
MRHQLTPVDSPLTSNALVMIHDQPQPCPYLEGRQARMPLHWPIRLVSPAEFDAYMEAGYRRSGTFLYRTRCGGCQACEPTRLDVERFCWSRSLRRVRDRGDRVLECRLQPPMADRSRVDLLNRHRDERNLASSGGPLSLADYEAFLVESCCDTQELSYWMGERLVALATVDLGATSLSAVYCFFDPDCAKLSLGTYSILKQIELAAATSRRYVYLGMYVAGNPHLNYKSRFVPQERRIDGRWQPIFVTNT